MSSPAPVKHPTGYVHQTYPTHYHHPDGRDIIVKSEEHLKAVLGTDPKWVYGSAPVKPPAPVVRPLTPKELEAKVREHEAVIQTLVKFNADLNEMVTDLTIKLDEVLENPRIQKLLL